MTEHEEDGLPLDGGLFATCPYCGEEVAVTVDPVGATHEHYVEDCPVCCRPWEVHVSREEGTPSVQLLRGDE